MRSWTWETGIDHVEQRKSALKKVSEELDEAEEIVRHRALAVKF